MDSVKHTPGPWVSFERTTSSNVYSMGNNGALLAVVHSYRDSWEHNISRVIRKANADLIAAAPDLLEALQDFERSCAFIGNTANRTSSSEIQSLGMEAWVRCMTNARAAIAKATGASNG